MNTIAFVILMLLLVHYAVESLADYLNLSQSSPDVPEDFADAYDPDRYAASQAYLKANIRFDRLTATLELVVFLGFWFAGGFGLLDRWIRSLNLSPVVSGLLYIGVLGGAAALLGMFFSIYKTFGIEERFGFNRTPWRLFLLDRLKALALTLILGGPLLAAVLVFFEYTGDLAWLWVWVFLTIFMMIMQVVVPAWIMPLFNRFTPLPEGDLKKAVTAYARQNALALSNVFVMDGSKRSAKSNAFFTGMGRKRKLVLFDTLVNNHSPAEIVAIVAHETGHYKKKHIVVTMLLSICQAGVMCYLLSYFISCEGLFAAFFVDPPSVYAGLVLFFLLFAPIEFFLNIGLLAILRRNERAADRFAAATTGTPEVLARALKRLSVDNLANLTPHPLYVFLHYSHPPVSERVRELTAA